MEKLWNFDILYQNIEVFEQIYIALELKRFIMEKIWNF